MALQDELSEREREVNESWSGRGEDGQLYGILVAANENHLIYFLFFFFFFYNGYFIYIVIFLYNEGWDGYIGIAILFCR